MDFQPIIDAAFKAPIVALSEWERLTGIDRSNVHHYLNGKRAMTFPVAQKFARAMGWNLEVKIKKPEFMLLTVEAAKSFVGKELIICTVNGHGMAGRWAWIKILDIKPGEPGKQGIGDKQHFYLEFQMKKPHLEPVEWGEWDTEPKDWLYSWQDVFRIGSSAHEVYFRVDIED